MKSKGSAGRLGPGRGGLWWFRRARRSERAEVAGAAPAVGAPAAPPPRRPGACPLRAPGAAPGPGRLYLLWPRRQRVSEDRALRVIGCPPAGTLPTFPPGRGRRGDGPLPSYRPPPPGRRDGAGPAPRPPAGPRPAAPPGPRWWGRFLPRAPHQTRALFVGRAACILSAEPFP